jgi:YjbE family integral membrane protein
MDLLSSFGSAAALLAFLQVVLIDVSLAGDNAIAVGLAAAGLPPAERRKAIIFGLAGAVVMLIGFALVAVQMLKIIGLLLAGGILLLWVSWKIFQDLRAGHAEEQAVGEAALDCIDDEGSGTAGAATSATTGKPSKTFRAAMVQILVADLSMSLDNVLAVAGAAREHPGVLVFGLLLSIILVGLAATWIAHLLQRFKWIGYIGLAIVLVVSVRMIWEGHRQVVVRTGETAAYNQFMPDALDIGPSEFSEFMKAVKH